jgi:hypothetical protein
MTNSRLKIEEDMSEIEPLFDRAYLMPYTTDGWDNERDKEQRESCVEGDWAGEEAEDGTSW